MLFITNRMPEQSLRSEADREWTFDNHSNLPSPSVFFCERGTGSEHTEIMAKEFMRRLEDDPARQILLFVHGFNASPQDGFESAQQMQEIADGYQRDFVRVVPVIWPALANEMILEKYYTARDAAMDSRSSFARAIQMFIDRQREQECADNRCMKPVSILAHSMGNRVLRETLFYLQDEFLSRGMPRLFRCIFMAGADVVNESLEQGRGGEHIADAAARVVVYYAYDDLALRGGKVINLDQVVSRRLGHTGPQDMNRVARNVYAIDCGSFNTDWDPPVGHSYYKKERGGSGRPSPLLLHALNVMEDLRVEKVEASREGRLDADASVASG